MKEENKMRLIKDRNIETERLYLKIPTMLEQYDLWKILKQEKVNKFYMATPTRFNNNRQAFQESLNNWEKQKIFYQNKINNLNSNDYIFTWSIFLKNGEVIGQITVQPNEEYENNPEIRNIGWFINPKYQKKGYAYEASSAILNFMFTKIEITTIKTSAVISNIASWKLMEKLGFIKIGEKNSEFSDEEGNILPAYIYEITKEKYKG